MSIKSELSTLLISALQDIRCAAPRLFIEDLIERTNAVGSIPQYRITNTDTSTPVTAISNLLTLISEDNINIRLSNSLTSSSFKDKTKPVFITLKNIEVNLSEHSEDDTFYSSVASSTKNTICFMMGYVGDNDTGLPMKLLDAYLVGKE